MFAHPGSSGRVEPPCRQLLSSCLDVWQLKSLWTGTIVVWDIIALLLRCVGVRGAAVGVVAPVGIAIQVTWLSFLVGSFTGCSVWLPQVSRWAWLWCHQISVRGLTVVCPGRFGIGYKCRVVARSSSIDTVPVTGSLLIAAAACRLTVCCAAGFCWGVLIKCSDCLRLALCRAFRFHQ